MIKFTNVSYSFSDGTKALKNINLEIKKGERVAVAGGNGSGKTTFALHINGILIASGGTVDVDGLTPSDDNDSRILKRKVGMVFQNPDNQLVSTTVERELAFSLENRNVPRSEMLSRVNNVLHLFGLANYRNRLTSELSGGEKQRLALAAVMVTEPDILILDEPSSYLDRAGRDILDKALERLMGEREELTVIKITQYASIAERYDRLIVFKDGGVFLDDRPEKIYANIEACRAAGIEIPFKYRVADLGSIKDSQDNPADNIRTGNTRNGNSISVEGAYFKYDNGQPSYTLEAINMKISSGRIYGLVGPTGSGKSTLIQLMAGLMKPLSGHVKCDNFSGGRGSVLVSFQHPERQFFLETVDKELRFGPGNLGLEGIEKIISESYEIIGLPEDRFAQRDPFTLSGGEKRRLAFGTIITMQPSFIFFDEPTCALDSPGVESFKRIVRRLQRDGIGILIVSHNGDIIFELADEIISLEEGRIKCVRTKEDFFTQEDFSPYLSVPEVVSYQLERFGRIKYFSESEIMRNL